MLTIQDRLETVGLWPTSEGVKTAEAERDLMARELADVGKRLKPSALFTVWLVAHCLLEQQKGG